MTEGRCHFRAFGIYPCQKPKGHEGEHVSNLYEPELPPITHEQHYLALLEIRELKDDRQNLILKGDAMATALSATGRAFAEHQVAALVRQWEEAKHGR